MNESKKTLAIIKGVKFGVDDRDRVSLQFSTYVTEGSAASQWIWEPEEYIKIIKDAYVTDVKNLEGRACYVDTSDPGFIKFERIAKI